MEKMVDPDEHEVHDQWTENTTAPHAAVWAARGH
jgi:hypothetical protein